jgi:hypothetical protein
MSPNKIDGSRQAARRQSPPLRVEIARRCRVHRKAVLSTKFQTMLNDICRSVRECGSRTRAGAILAGAAMFWPTPSVPQVRAEGDARSPSTDVASTAAWPDATSVMLLPSEGLVITKAGTVISGLDITVHINAANVALEKCRVTSGGWAVVQIQPDVSGAVVQDCTINGTGSAPDATGNQGIKGQGKFLRNNIYNVENGITLTGHNTVIQDNYIHDLNVGGSPHYDGIQIDGGISNLKIRHNTIINSHGAAGAIMIDNDFGAISNVTVDNNLLAGAASRSIPTSSSTTIRSPAFRSPTITSLLDNMGRHCSGGMRRPTPEMSAMEQCCFAP